MHEVLVVGLSRFIYVERERERAVCSIVPLHILLLDCTVQCLSWHAKVSVLGMEV